MEFMDAVLELKKINKKISDRCDNYLNVITEIMKCLHPQVTDTPVIISFKSELTKVIMGEVRKIQLEETKNNESK